MWKSWNQNKMTQKINILIIILAIFILTASIGFAARDTKIGSIDMSVENQVKVCKDNTCTKPTPGIIYFKVSSESPLVVDTENGLSGKVWGDELGWVTFNPPYGGVFFADPTTGLLKGTAWSENSGAINFSVTGQKVVIDPKTGEWNGWAWASGPYGGWIKFDCKDTTSCVHTIWGNKKAIPPPPTSAIDEEQKGEQSLPAGQTSFIRPFLAHISYSFENLFDIIGQKFSNAYNFVAIYLVNVFSQNSLVNKVDDAISPVSNLDKVQTPEVSPAIEIEEVPVLTNITEVQLSPTLGVGENIKNVFDEKSKIMSDTFGVFVTKSADLFKKITAIKYQVFDKTGDSYYTFSSNLINLRSSVLEGVDNLFK